jgi:hypothetical protein
MSARDDMEEVAAARAAAVERAIARTAAYQAEDERGVDGMVDWAAARVRWGDDFERLNSKMQPSRKVEFGAATSS